jgi:acylphosphatase
MPPFYGIKSGLYFWLIRKEMKTVYILVKGKVQGVFYRATAKEVAEKNGLAGWVKNTKEGDVACLVTGENGAIDAFIDWCRKGPSRAVVTHVQTEEKILTPFDEFKIIR